MKADDYARAYSRHRSSRQSARRKRTQRIVAALLTVVLLAVAALCYVWVSEPEPNPLARATPANAQPAERTAALAPLSLPADDAPHGSGMEWWYYNGILNAANGERYAFHVAVFVAPGLVKHTAMHAALTDLQTGCQFLGTYGADGTTVTSSAPRVEAAPGGGTQQRCVALPGVARPEAEAEG